MRVTKSDIERGLRAVGLDERSHVLVHSSYKAFGGVEDGPLTVVKALADTVATVMMPAFTWERTLMWDASGLFEGNAYRPTPSLDTTPEPFDYGTPIDENVGVIPKFFRLTYPVRRSSHPLQSFIAFGELAAYLAGSGGDIQDIEPLRRLTDAHGDVLLIGVTHTASTAVHLAEQLAGRKLFVRHALTAAGVRAVTCGGCSEAFDALQPHVGQIERQTVVGNAVFRGYPLPLYVETARRLILRDPFALLCEMCDRCRAHRSRVAA